MTNLEERVLQVVIASHREIVVRGVAAILADHPAEVLVTVAPSLRSVDPVVDVVLYDLALLEVSGVTPLQDLVRSVGGRVIGIAGHGDTALQLVAEENGVAGCVTSDVHGEQLVKAIVTVAAGEQLRRADPEQGPLSPRETEIMGLIVQGLSNEQIAQKLFISPNTLKSHIRQSYRKIGATTRAQAVAWASHHGFPTG